MLVVFTLAVIGVVGILIALATGTWWVLAPALLAHLLAFAIAVGYIGRRLEQEDKPDPLTEARDREHPSEHRESPSPDDRDEPHMAI